MSAIYKKYTDLKILEQINSLKNPARKKNNNNRRRLESQEKIDENFFRIQEDKRKLQG